VTAKDILKERSVNASAVFFSEAHILNSKFHKKFIQFASRVGIHFFSVTVDFAIVNFLGVPKEQEVALSPVVVLDAFLQSEV